MEAAMSVATRKELLKHVKERYKKDQVRMLL